MFKNVSSECFIKLYSLIEQLPFYYFFGNNLLTMTSEGDSESVMSFGYKYNNENYPILLMVGDKDSYNISYIEAK